MLIGEVFGSDENQKRFLGENLDWLKSGFPVGTAQSKSHISLPSKSDPTLRANIIQHLIHRFMFLAITTENG